jgi:Protein of unknown function (DUF3040)
MLNQDDQRRLAAIEAQIHAEDTVFAESLARGQPHCPRGDRRWPFQLIIAAGVLLLIIGLNHAVLFLVIVGAGTTVGGWRADCYRRTSRHRPHRRRF